MSFVSVKHFCAKRRSFSFLAENEIDCLQPLICCREWSPGKSCYWTGLNAVLWSAALSAGCKQQIQISFQTLFSFQEHFKSIALAGMKKTTICFLSPQFLSCSRLLTDPRSHSSQPTPEEQSSSGSKPPSSVLCCAQAQIIQCSNTCNRGWICTSSNERKKKRFCEIRAFVVQIGAAHSCLNMRKKGGKEPNPSDWMWLQCSSCFHRHKLSLI